MNHKEAKALVDSFVHDERVSLFVRSVAWLESNYGQKSAEPDCHNWGNIIWTGNQNVPYFVADDSGNERHFVCYSQPKFGAEALESLLRRKYPKALEAARANDWHKASAAMKAGGYYEAPEERYSKGLYGAALTICRATGEKPPNPPSGGLMSWGLLAVFGVGVAAYLLRSHA